MIPKVIHFCWLSNDPFPEKIQECIDSWKKNMPDYEIKRWSTENFDVNSVPLVKEAYEAKKYAFAADYIRCYSLYKEGGVYLDSDVMVQKNMTELFKNYRYITGMEFRCFAKKLYKRQVDDNGQRREGVKSVAYIGLQAAIMASEPGHPLMKKCLEFYEDKHLNEILDNRLLAPIVQAQAAEEFGYRYIDSKQELAEGIVIYPNKIFGQWKKEKKGRYALHLITGSWSVRPWKSKLIHKLEDFGIYQMYIRLKDMLGLIK